MQVVFEGACLSVPDESVVKVRGKQVYPALEPKPPAEKTYGVGDWFEVADSTGIRKAALCGVDAGMVQLIDYRGNRLSPPTVEAPVTRPITLEVVRKMAQGKGGPPRVFYLGRFFFLCPDGRV